MQKVRLFINLPGQHQYWFIWCYFFSGFARAMILLLPFRWLSPFLGTYYKNIKLDAPVTKDQQLLAWHIGRITTLACKYTPWESKCLVQALLAKYLLRKQNIPSVLYIGVLKSEPDNDLKAHAWLCAGKWVVTGREGRQPFSIVSTFVSPSTLVNPLELPQR